MRIIPCAPTVLNNEKYGENRRKDLRKPESITYVKETIE